MSSKKAKAAAAADEQSKPSLLAQALKPGQVWEKDDLNLVLHWFRQFLALAIGIACGIVPIQGWMGIAGYVCNSLDCNTNSLSFLFDFLNFC